MAIPIIILGRESIENKVAKENAAYKIKSYLKSDEGAGMLLKAPLVITDFMQETFRLTNHHASADSLKKISERFGSTKKGLFYASWFVGTIELVEKVSEEGVRDGNWWTEFTRRCCKWISNACDSVFLFCLPTSNSTLKNVQLMTDLASDSISTYQAGSGWAMANSELDRAGISDEVQNALKEEKKLQLLSIVKSVASVVAGIFGLLGLILGCAVVPAIVLLTISLATSALSVIKHFYKENMDYKPYSDWKPARIEA